MKSLSVSLITIFAIFAAATAASGYGSTGSSSADFAEVFCGTAPPAFRPERVVRPPHDGPVTIDVSIASFAFTPPNLTINVGDTVRWINNDGRAHTSTSDSSVWDSASIAPTSNFSFTFTAPGEFPYHCSIHTFMTANITVQEGPSPTPTPAGSLVINEIDYDQPGTDSAEFIELKNVSGGMINLDPVVVELINGAACCTPYQSFDLPNVNLPAGGYYVICGDNAAVLNCDLIISPGTNLVQNGAPDAVGLRISGNLVDAVSYEGDTGAPYTEGSGVGLSDDGIAAFQGISRFPDGVDTDMNNVDLSLRCITPGAANTSANTGCAATSPTPTPTFTPTNTPTNTATATPTPCGSTVVTTVASSGAGSIHDVIANACDGATITFSLGSGAHTIFLLNPHDDLSSSLVINKNLSIIGPGADLLNLQRSVGATNARIFHILPAHTVLIQGITLSGGQLDGPGAGIYNDHSNLTVRDCAFVQNISFSGGSNDGNGGGIMNEGRNGPTASLDVINCTFDGDQANTGGGAIYNRGVTGGNATAHITNSTFSGNSVAGFFGVIYNDGQFGQANMTVTNSTISNNVGTSFYNDGTGGIGSLKIGNTIMNNNPNVTNGGTITSLGYNIANDGGGGFLTSTGDQINTAPMLGPLQNNGGTTFTMAPNAGSPAIDKGKDIGPVSPLHNPTGEDQRSLTRPFDDPSIAPASGGDNSDIGAFEFQTVAPTPTATSTPTDTPTDTATNTPTPANTPSISGTITYGNAIGNPVPPRFVKNVSVASTAGSPAVGPVITGTPGTYTLTGFGAGSYTIKPTKPGGTNTAITSNDAARVAQGVSGSVPFVTLNQKFASDASGNGTVSSNDAALIARFAAGLTGTGNVGQWKFFTANLPGLPTGPLPTPPYNDSRTYASVTGNATGDDYVALLIGEASGNYNPATHPRPGARVESVDGGEGTAIAVTAHSVVTGADKEIVVPISVEGVRGKYIISYEFDLRYDPAVIQPLENPVDVVGTVSRGLMVVTNPFEPGLLRVVVYGPMPIDDDGVLLNLRFTAVGKLGSVSPLSWERMMFNEGDLGTTTTDGQVELLAAAAS